jgi:hypothetical protein
MHFDTQVRWASFQVGAFSGPEAVDRTPLLSFTSVDEGLAGHDDDGVAAGASRESPVATVPGPKWEEGCVGTTRSMHGSMSAMTFIFEIFEI